MFFFCLFVFFCTISKNFQKNSQNKIIFLDEPTAALGVVQTHNVLELIKRVRDKGIGVVFISHSMPEVLSVADSVQVLRRGRRVMTLAAKSTTLEELVGAMTGALDEEVR